MQKYLQRSGPQHRPSAASNRTPGRAPGRKKNGRSRSGASARKGASSRSKSTPSTIDIDASLGRYRVFATLLVAVLFVTAIFFIARLDTPASEPSRAPGASIGNTAATPTTKPDSIAEFSFYSMLHDLEIEIPEPTERQSTNSGQSNTRYVIQAGSFKTAAQAERRLVELKLLGLNPRVGEVENANGERWHRVMLGPFASRSQMAGVRSVMISNNIEAMVMQRKH